MKDEDIKKIFEKSEGITMFSDAKIKSIISLVQERLSYAEQQELIRRLKEL